MKDRFKRVVNFYGEANFVKIRESKVIIAGLGGVGSHAASALARSGIGTLYLVDFDSISESSLNRNSVVGGKYLNEHKAIALSETLKELCPDTSYIPINAFICEEYLEQNDLHTKANYFIDAIDSVNPKTQLLEFCVKNKVSVFSSMGAAGRRDISKLRTGDISETVSCPLAKRVKKYLRKRGVSTGIPCVWSAEKAVKPLPPDEDEPHLDGRGRVRNTLPSLITMPGIFGYAIAQLVLDAICLSESTGR